MLEMRIMHKIRFPKFEFLKEKKRLNVTMIFGKLLYIIKYLLLKNNLVAR